MAILVSNYSGIGVGLVIVIVIALGSDGDSHGESDVIRIALEKPGNCENQVTWLVDLVSGSKSR